MSYAREIAESVAPYQPADKAALREFQQEYFGPASRQCDDEFCDWLHERNPHRRQDEPVLWLCKRDGAVVGQQASIPVLLKVGDLQYRACWGIDLMVHRHWRLKGVGPALFAAYERTGEASLGLGIDDAAYRVCRRAGWTDMGSLSLFVRALDPQACAAALQAPKLLTKVAPRLLVSGSARVIGRVAGALTRVCLDPTPAFDERVDRVWIRASRDFPVLVKRDFVSVRWRFDEVPYRGSYERYYLTRRGQIIGYAVVRLEKWHGRFVGRLVDYLTERRWLAPLFALVIEELNAKGAVAVFVEQLYAGAQNVLRSLGCLRVRASKRFMFNVRDRASPLAVALSRADGWFITPSDSDFDHIALAIQNHG